MHGGDISVESDGEGLGSTFTVTLPLTQVDCYDIEDGPMWNFEDLDMISCSQHIVVRFQL
jgi:hypothetical protein